VTRPVRLVLIVLLMMTALSFLRAGRAWEAAQPQAPPTHGAAYGLAVLAMIVITLAALKRRGGRR